MSHFNLGLQPLSNNSKQTSRIETCRKSTTLTICYECKKDITFDGLAYKDRKRHFMQFTNEVYTCIVCLFALPTECALKAHIRLHLKCHPHFCPECGIQLPNKNVQYPYNHDCDGFKMMRATARLQCPMNNTCHNLHPNYLKEHMKQNHLKKVYRCQLCVVACFNGATMMKHLKKHKSEAKAVLFYQCELCPGRLVIKNHMEQHLNTHVNTVIFPCWSCGVVCKNVRDLLLHHIKQHKYNNIKTTELLSAVMNECKEESGKQRIYRVVKKCDQCKRSFIYKCTYDYISTLPIRCPYECSARLQSKIETEESQQTNSQLVCYMCKNKISQDWEEIKKHFNVYHKNYRCLDIKIELNRLDIGNYFKDDKTKKDKRNLNYSKKTYKNIKGRQKSSDLEVKDIIQPDHSSPKINGEQSCYKCSYKCDSKYTLEKHIITHRDPCMAYQCLECGQSFVVKPSFSTHLLLEHKITDVENYISTKHCYNEHALSKLKQNEEINEPICENQCTICREQFDNSEDLQKHFRVHGMAFLMKNNTNKVNTN